jgi:PAS domain-containing protein
LNITSYPALSQVFVESFTITFRPGFAVFLNNIPILPKKSLKETFNKMIKIKDSIEELKRNSDRFHVAAAVTGSLIYEWDLESGKVRWFGDVEDIFGIKKDNLPKSVSGLMEFIHNNDRQRIVDEIERERSGGFSRSFECRIRNLSDNSWRLWNLSINTVESEEGILKKIYGICKEPGA